MIRQASSDEMLALWGFKNPDDISPTARFFAENIRSGNAEFWTIDHCGALIGELYLFKALADKDFADGRTRAYLCAFRIQKEYRGQGLGSRLLEAVLARLRDCGFSTVTIGVDESEEDNIRLYRRHGFLTKIKDCTVDPCSLDSQMNPTACPCFWLLSRNLDETNA